MAATPPGGDQDAETAFLQDAAAFLAHCEPLVLASDDTSAAISSPAPTGELDSSPSGLTDEEQQSEASVGSSSPPFANTQKPATKPKKRNAHRERVKVELASLRQQASNLQAEVERRQTTAAAMPTRGLATPELAVWSDIAHSQHQALQLAEEENTKLRAALAGHACLAQELQSLLHKRPHFDSRDADMTKTQPTKKVRVDPNDVLLFEAYTAELDALYVRTKAAFADSELDMAVNHAVASQTTTKRDENTDKLFLEATSVVLLPVDYFQSRKSLSRTLLAWYRSQQRGDSQTVEYSGVERPDCTVAGKLVLNGPWSGLRVTFVIRQYDEAKQSVIVWRMLTEADDGSKLEGMNADETGWVILRSSLESQDQPTTVVHAVVHIVPLEVKMRQHHLDQPSARTSEDAITVAVVDDTMLELSEKLGDLFLEAATTGSEGSASG